MTDWLTINWLALYAAIVGTVALGINYAKFRHAIKANQVSLKVSYEKSPDFEKNIALLLETDASTPWDRPSIVEAYLVKALNTGSINAFIQSAGVVTIGGECQEALVPASGESLILNPVSRSTQEPLPPMSSRSYCIYLNRNEPMFDVSYGFIQDQTGKEWRSKA